MAFFLFRSAMNEALMIIGFMMAAYAVIGNDSIQTLGTFLYSNAHRPWWVLWLYSSSIMVAVILYGWSTNDGDATYKRLNKVYSKAVSLEASQSELAAALATGADGQVVLIDTLGEQLKAAHTAFDRDPRNLEASMAEARETLAAWLALDLSGNEAADAARVVAAETVEAALDRMDARSDVSKFITWPFLIPPIALLILTRVGYPVSTSFLVIITFQPAVLGDMVLKSLAGYGVAFLSAMFLYIVVVRVMEKRWRTDGETGIHPAWVVLQWCSTAFLWAMWLAQDMSNVFAYLPRVLNVGWLVFALCWLVVIQAIIYATHGGKIQDVVRQKTNTHDVRSATIVDLLYGLVLYIFKVQSDLPMSTTWVFLGLLAGRELAISFVSQDRNTKWALGLMGKDAMKATFGLIISVIIAMFIEWMHVR